VGVFRGGFGFWNAKILKDEANWTGRDIILTSNMIIILAMSIICVKIITIQNAMITSTLAPAAMNPAMMLLPTQLLTLPSVQKEASRLEPVKRWRMAHPELFEQRRIEGMKKSDLVRENLMRLHREKKAEWHKSARKNPKLRATVEHIAAKEWSLKAPSGVVYRFRNLKQFLRGNAELFDVEDVIWKEVPGRPSQAWCRAFHGLSRLRPSCVKLLPDWKGWTWSEE
jgi:hypothetical protein